MHIFIMIILISLLIIVHELGHFFAAKMFGIKVVKFGIGLPIGPTLYSHKFKETEFIIHAFLFGGYVAFIEDEENEKDKKEGEEEVPADSPLRFENKPAWQKAIVLVAGVTMNFLFAVFLIVLAAMCYHKLPTGKQEVFVHKIVREDNTSNIVNSDIQEGDRILRINNINVETAGQFIFVVQNSKYYNGTVTEEIKNKKLAQLKALNHIESNDFLKKGTVIKLPKFTPENALNVSSDVTKGYENYKSDEIKLSSEEIKLRDELKDKASYIVPSDNLYTLDNIALAVSDTYKPITITLVRDSKEITINNIYTNEDGMLGVVLNTKDIYMDANSLSNIVKSSFGYTVENTKLMLFGFKQIFTGKISASEMHGIILIAKVGGDVIKESGLLDGLLLTAIISINLAILNLLPIPALDGGQLLFLIIEKISGRKLDNKKVSIINGIFFILLLAVMVLILFNDIYALVIHKY